MKNFIEDAFIGALQSMNTPSYKGFLTSGFLVGARLKSISIFFIAFVSSVFFSEWVFSQQPVKISRDRVGARMTEERAGLLAFPSVQAEKKGCAAAFRFFKKKEWKAAHLAASYRSCPTLSKLSLYYNLKKSKVPQTFQTYVRFIKENPGWPFEKALWLKAEGVAEQEGNPHVLVTWFRQHPPQTFKGVQLFLSALQALGKGQEHASYVRHFWVQRSFSASQAKDFFKNHRSLLRASDHRARTERLFASEDFESLKTHVFYVPRAEQKKINVRLALRSGQPHAHQLVTTLSPAVQKTPEMRLDFLVWLVKTYHIKGPMYFQKNKDLIKFDEKRAWKMGHILIRRALEEGRYNQAYDLAAHHGLTSGLAFSEAQWILGWTSLRFLNKPQRAYEQFKALFRGVHSTPSRARGAYWAGRAADALGRRKEALEWYQKAAGYSSTYYGHLAAAVLKKPLPKVASHQVSLAHLQQEGRPLPLFAKVALLLKEADRSEEAFPFLSLLYARARTVEDKARVLAWAHQVASHYPLTLVRISKGADTFLINTLYPRLNKKLFKSIQNLDFALVHAVVRQESGFDFQAVSSAGAVGLMQLLPHVAENLAFKNRVKRSRSFLKDPGLLKDPRYNVPLGCLHLKEMLDRYTHCEVLALAAYNAGATNVEKWIQYFEDPRKKGVDIIDWIEKISFGETRNYIQRIIEARKIYYEMGV